eukprot:12425064-Karenia_brevis.AAC.1
MSSCTAKQGNNDMKTAKLQSGTGRADKIDNQVDAKSDEDVGYHKDDEHGNLRQVIHTQNEGYLIRNPWGY